MFTHCKSGHFQFANEKLLYRDFKQMLASDWSEMTTTNVVVKHSGQEICFLLLSIKLKKAEEPDFQDRLEDVHAQVTDRKDDHSHR